MTIQNRFAWVIAAGLWLLAVTALLYVGNGVSPALAIPYTVTKTADTNDGVCDFDCSLREAIGAANANAGGDIITFDPGAFPGTITLGSALPALSVGGDTIDGSSAGVVVDGVTETFDCFALSSSGNTVMGLLITGCANGITITGAGNLIGGTIGVTPGGPCTGACNVISGNAASGGSGILITGASATGNQIQGNYIGTDAAGTAAFGNDAGINFGSSASGNTIGGPSIFERNIIAGNSGPGVVMFNPGGTVQGNYIGLDVNGAALGNLIGIFGIPATSAISGNVVSSNTSHGIQLIGATTGGVVLGNLVGTDPTGSIARPNGANGIHLSGTKDTTIGSTASPNTIAFNGTNGICLGGTATATGNALRANSIHSNGGLGIDLAVAGVCASAAVTANDTGDADTGANSLQNFPVLTSATTGGGSTTIVGTLNSTASTSFTLDFFSSPTCDASGNGEGRVYLGSLSPVTTDAGGNAGFTATGLAATTAGNAVTATATRNAAPLSTSEFSACTTIDQGLGQGPWSAVFSDPPSHAGDCAGTIVGPSSNLVDGGGLWSCESNHSPVASGGAFHAVLTGSSISGTITWSSPPSTTTFTGTVAADGRSFAGTYTGSFSSGTYSAALQTATSPGVGQIVTGTESSLTFGSANGGGSTSVINAPTTGGTLPPQFQLVGEYYHVITTVSPTGPGTGPYIFCATYTETSPGMVDGTLEGNLHIAHLEGSSFVQYARHTPGSSTSTNTVCASVDSLSEFALVAADTDTDGVVDDSDNCPALANGNQLNSDGDSLGNACDNCPTTSNANQLNSDSDGLGDACDNCPTTANANQLNTDSDGPGNACDNCPVWPNTSQALPLQGIQPTPGDADCDGFPDTTAVTGRAAETSIGTDPLVHCAATPGANNDGGLDTNPMDFNDDRIYNGQDTGQFGGAGGGFNKPVSGGPYNGRPGERYNFNGDTVINGADTGKYGGANGYFNETCVTAGP